MKLSLNDYDSQKKFWDRCVEIMSEDENKECYKDALILTAFYNDWDEEDWLDIP